MSKKILLVLTSHDKLGDTGAATGTWLEELAASYYPLVEEGYTVDVASIAGGSAPLDPASLEAPWKTDTGQRFLDDPTAIGKVKASTKIDAVDIASYDAVYMIGGAGTVWDFPGNAALGRALEHMHRGNKVMAGICHGVSAFLHPVAGAPIAKGRQMTAISDAEEAMVGYDKIVPILPESALRKAGATVTVAPPLEARVVRDGNLITGQNPASAGPVAKSIIEALGA
jgi:putative intracellular protease/amidase